MPGTAAANFKNMETMTSCGIRVEEWHAPRRPRTRRAGKRRPARRTTVADSDPEIPDDDLNLPAAGTLARTKRLILAALRVWELKHGIRE
jgi:hypothetical protein